MKEETGFELDNKSNLSEYEKQRNKMIPFAVKYANKSYGKTNGKYENDLIWQNKWNICFLKKMDKLCEENKIVGYIRKSK